uniref:Uncharacterized protein n=1 Tax=Avena sativa TaxID=4498 RepID=A0ACD5X4P8_AVESA
MPSYLAMKTDPADTASEAAQALIRSDLRELSMATRKLANDAIVLGGGGLGFGTFLFKWLALIAALYLLVLDRTNWKTNILTVLLVPYMFFTLPDALFEVFRGEVSYWISFVVVLLELFCRKYLPAWLELPGSVILLSVVAPSLFADTFRNDFVGVGICLIIGCYLLQEHIKASGGFRAAFSKANGVSNTIGIVLLFVYPVWAFVLCLL